MPQAKAITWVLEQQIFPSGDCIADVAESAGHRIVAWKDEWWATQSWPKTTEPCVFHGSLGNADRIVREIAWAPGAFCNTPAFFCSAWYEQAASFLLHPRWRILPASQLVEHGDEIFENIGDGNQLFVRPDSPLKPFSGRVVTRGKLTMAALDHGFYYDDPNIPVVVAPVQSILREWRFVVVNRVVVAGSEYIAVGRTTGSASDPAAPRKFALRVAEVLSPPDPVYVLDVCETPNGLCLVELNPFSGADLYGCDGDKIVHAIAAAI